MRLPARGSPCPLEERGGSKRRSGPCCFVCGEKGQEGMVELAAPELTRGPVRGEEALDLQSREASVELLGLFCPTPPVRTSK